jgi:hypothetical protein
MSGAPGPKGNLFLMTLEEGRQWAKDTAAAIDATFHGGQSGGKRTEKIEAALLQQMDKACK